MASNAINAFEGKLLEALNILPHMDKSDRLEALRLFGQTAQFFHLQQEQQQQQQQLLGSESVVAGESDGDGVVDFTTDDDSAFVASSSDSRVAKAVPDDVAEEDAFVHSHLGMSCLEVK